MFVWQGAVTLCLALAISAMPAAADPATMKGVDITSFGYDAYGDSSSDAVLRRMAADHANWVAITAVVPVDRATDKFLPYVPNDASQTGPNTHMAHAVAYAKRLGLKVSLKLHPVDSDMGQVLQNYAYTPKSTKVFFASYRKTLLRYAKFGQAHHVDLLVIGTELGALITGPANKSEFTKLISAVRAVFTGKLTYAATSAELPSYRYGSDADCDWCREADELHWLSFWNQLDYVGIDAYPMLTADPKPSAKDLVDAMYDAPDLIEHTSERFNQIAYWEREIKRIGKPAILTETGAYSANGTALCTGCGPSINAKAPRPLLQSNVISAMLQAYSKNRTGLRLAGIFLWNANAYVMDDRADTTLGYGFIGKPAESVISSTYSKPP